MLLVLNVRRPHSQTGSISFSLSLTGKQNRGFYHDAIFVKRNNFNLLLHETFGGGASRSTLRPFSPECGL